MQVRGGAVEVRWRRGAPSVGGGRSCEIEEREPRGRAKEGGQGGDKANSGKVGRPL